MDNTININHLLVFEMRPVFEDFLGLIVSSVACVLMRVNSLPPRFVTQLSKFWESGIEFLEHRGKHDTRRLKPKRGATTRIILIRYCYCLRVRLISAACRYRTLAINKAGHLLRRLTPHPLPPRTPLSPLFPRAKELQTPISPKSRCSTSSTIKFFRSPPQPSHQFQNL
jgi:hypothetical protein